MISFIHHKWLTIYKYAIENNLAKKRKKERKNTIKWHVLI